MLKQPLYINHTRFLKDSLMNIKYKITAFIWNSKIINVFTVTFDQFNASLLNKSIYFFQKTFLYRKTCFRYKDIFHMYLACLSALAQICLFTVCLLGFHSQQQWMVTGAQMACCVYVCVSENRERQTHHNKSSTSARLPEDQHHIDTKMQHSPIWTPMKPH